MGFHQLRIARFNGSSWDIEVVDSIENFYQADRTSIKFAPDGQPAIAFISMSAEFPLRYYLNFARFDGEAWETELVYEVEDTIGRQDMAFAPDGSPSIVFKTHDEGVKFAHLDGEEWQFESFITGAGLGSGDRILAYGPDGNPSVVFSCYENLYLARYDGIEWSPELVEENGGGGGGSHAYDHDGLPAISYSDNTGELRYAHFNGADWENETVDTRTNFTSLAFDPGGGPAIAYEVYDQIKFAWCH
jgi:hypothetical protein